MLLAVEKGVNVPVNLGSGTGVTIKELTETIAESVPNGPIKIIWDKDKPKGDKKRVRDMGSTERLLRFKPSYSLKQGIKETIE